MSGVQPVLESDKHTAPNRFCSLAPALVSAIADLGVHTPTLIQTELQAPIEQGRDVIAVAPTGSGKTLAYLLPLLQRWVVADANNKPKTLILLPTRELARQSYDVISQLTPKLPWLKVVILQGGVSINPQLMALRGGADFVVATPGRLLDVIQHNGLKVSTMNHLVLDEADRLLDEGFSDELDVLLLQMTGAQTVLVSATFSRRLKNLSARRLSTPVLIDQGSSIECLTHRVIEVDKPVRTDVLIHLLRVQKPKQVLVFVARHREADTLAAALIKAGIPARALHGKLSHATRTLVMDGFAEGEIHAVVATDLAARGLDVPGLPMVVNHGLPRSPGHYLHRAGRTGRAGRSGQVINLVDADSRSHMSLIEKRCSLNLARERIEGFLPSDVPVQGRFVGDANGGIKGRRPSRKDRLRAARSADDPAIE